MEYKHARDVGSQGGPSAQSVVHDVLRQKRTSVESNLHVGALLNGLHRHLTNEYESKTTDEKSKAKDPEKEYKRLLTAMGLGDTEANNLREISEVDAFWNQNVITRLPLNLSALLLLSNDVFHKALAVDHANNVTDGDYMGHCLTLGCLSTQSSPGAVKNLLAIKDLDNWKQILNGQKKEADEKKNTHWTAKPPRRGGASKHKTLFTVKVDLNTTVRYSELKTLEVYLQKRIDQIVSLGAVVEMSKATDEQKENWFPENVLDQSIVKANDALDVIGKLAGVDIEVVGAAVTNIIKKKHVVALMGDDEDHDLLCWMRDNCNDLKSINRLLESAASDVDSSESEDEKTFTELRMEFTPPSANSAVAE
jgi:hypothetical protein